MTTMMMITASDACKEVVQRTSNECELCASRSTQKHERMKCIFFSPSKLHRHSVLEAVLTLSFTGEISRVTFFISQVSLRSNITKLKPRFEV